ncbi:MAG: VOC family protein [Acidobacteria bacterium]|nr:VOC family protein [Acidobacteriota bacterium]
MKRVTGIGGIFFKAQDAKALRAWYQQHLGIEISEWGGHAFVWRDAENPEGNGVTVWSIFPSDTPYFDSGDKPFMINYRVENLDQLLAQLRTEGVTVEDKIAEEENGRFAWIFDLEGNRVELWEPAKGM